MRALLALVVLVTACATTPPPVAKAPDPAARPDHADLRASLADARARHIQHLRDYAAAGEFPRNRIAPGMINVFIDEDGRLCAVANLMVKGGARALVDATAKANNTIVLGDVTDGPLMDWMLRSGFTQEEIAVIQEPYMEDRSPVSWLDEQKRLREHFDKTIAMLEATTDASLDLAVARLMRG